MIQNERFYSIPFSPPVSSWPAKTSFLSFFHVLWELLHANRNVYFYFLLTFYRKKAAPYILHLAFFFF